MAMVKRIFLFLALNVLVVTTLSVILNLLGIKPYLRSYGLDLPSLMAFCFVWGMGGAFISLLLSKQMAKWLMGVQIIHPNNIEYKSLIEMVRRLSSQAGLKAVPEIGIFESPEANAFATGPTQRHSLVAISTGLLQKMSPAELEGVIAHELSHIASGDMVTMTLLQGVVNAFVMFLARVLAFAISGIGKNRESNSSNSYFGYSMLVLFFDIVFMLLGSIVLATFSRFREFRADKGGARIAGKEKMISALESLRAQQHLRDPRIAKPAYAALKMSNPGKSGLLALFSTHPPLEDRIARLRE